MELEYKEITFQVDSLKNLLIDKNINIDSCYWIIKSDQLFLSKFENDVATKEFANWVNYSIEIRFVNCFFVIKIENGIVKNKYIGIEDYYFQDIEIEYFDQYFNSYSTFNFSDLKDNLLSILKNKSKHTNQGKYTDLIELEFQKIYNSFSEPSFDDIELIVGRNFIFFYMCDLVSNHTSKIIEYCIEYLNEDLAHKKNNTIDFQYIKWAIRNLKWFVLHPSFFSKEIEVVKKIQIQKINNLYFEFEIIKENINFSDFLNFEDYEFNLKKMNLKFDKINNLITFDFPQYSYFNYLLDDTICFDDLYKDQKKWKKVIETINKSKYNYDYEDEEDIEYERPNDSNWLRDAAGTDEPQTMNDVFWNID